MIEVELKNGDSKRNNIDRFHNILLLTPKKPPYVSSLNFGEFSIYDKTVITLLCGNFEATLESRDRW